MMIENRAGVRADASGWNWGAFMYNWIWGVGNKAYLTLLALIPGFGLIWMFVCGAMGNKWAWENSDYDSYETFLQVQKTWNRAGILQLILALAGFLLLILFWGVLSAIVGLSTRGMHGF